MKESDLSQNLYETRIVKKIKKAKEVWQSIKEIHELCASNEIYFMGDHLHGLFNSFEKEINAMRIELCKERKE
jgi:hypothetical protein